MSNQPTTAAAGEALVAASRHLFAAGVMSHAGHAHLSAPPGADRFAPLSTTLAHQELPGRREPLLRFSRAVAVRESMARVRS